MNGSLFVANWKMNMPFERAIHFATTHKKALISLAQMNASTIVLCPSFVALAPIAQLFADTPIIIGAQNCSAYTQGAYTGEVDALSLAQIGCSYTIVGHSERRMYFNENNDTIGQKLVRLFEQNITPILCIGESKHEFDKKITVEILAAQLNPLITLVQEKKYAQPFVVAYEPVWSIGTGIVPDHGYLSQVSQWIHQTIKEQCKKSTYRLLYGGSVDQENGATIAATPGIQGFLIGGASLDFQKFQNIVSLMHNS